jgi:response regulator RpfG family c-di-GMP phosphodiesterase
MYLDTIMNYHAQIRPFDISHHAKNYAFDANKFRKLENRIAEKIIAYDTAYGHYLLDHLNRTSRYLEEFMIFRGYDADTARKVSTAFRLHDAGKISQHISVWEHTDEKPDQAKKDIRAEHTMLGKQVVLDTLDELKLDLNEDDRNHLKLVFYLQQYHHERENGKGPRRLPGDMMDPILKMAGILDEIDGKTKLDHESLEAIFSDIRGRHSDKFASRVVEDCYQYCRAYGRYGDLSSLMSPSPYSLA